MNSRLKKIMVAGVLLLHLALPSGVLAQGQEEYEASLMQQALDHLEQVKKEATYTLDSLKERVRNIPRNDDRRQQALEAIADVEKEVAKLQNLSGVTVTEAMGSALPTVEPSVDFALQQQKVQEGFTAINRILIAPVKPATVPEGDLVEDFIPQLVRQLFRFAWVAVLISMVVSGVMLVMVFGNDERVENAKKMLYFSLVGFVFVALAFAIVTAITDIDFFRFL